jgi:acyl-coenzyme A thioesterase PaaI-like protein
MWRPRLFHLNLDSRIPRLTPDDFNRRGVDHLPGHLGIVITQVSSRELRAELAIRKALMAPNGYLHAAPW